MNAVNGPICPTCHQAWPQETPPAVVPTHRTFREAYPYPGPFPGSVWGTVEDNLRSMGELRGRPRHEIVGRLGEPTNVRYEGGLRLLEWARAGALGALRVVLVFDSSDTCGGLVDGVEDSPDAAFYESLLNRPAEKPKPAPAVNWNIGVWFPIDI